MNTVNCIKLEPCYDCDMFGTQKVGILVAIVNHGMAAQSHHLAKLEHFLCECARNIFTVGDGVLYTKTVKPHIYQESRVFISIYDAS